MVHRFYVEIADGSLRIRFIERVGFHAPIVSAIEVSHRPDLTQ